MLVGLVVVVAAATVAVRQGVCCVAHNTYWPMYYIVIDKYARVSHEVHAILFLSTTRPCYSDIRRVNHLLIIVVHSTPNVRQTMLLY